MKRRKHGFYRIRRHGVWTVGHYCYRSMERGGRSVWLIPGSQREYIDPQLEEIDETELSNPNHINRWALVSLVLMVVDLINHIFFIE